MSDLAADRLRDRAPAARAVLVVAFLLLLAAFFRAQVVNSADYRLQSEKNRLRQVPLMAPRGAILDRNGVAIADNVPGYTVKLFAPSVDSLRALLERLQRIVSLDSGDLELIVRRFRAAQYQPALLFAGAARETVARLEEHRYLLPGLVIQTEPRRTYPAGSAVAHLAGYVGEVSEDELGKDRYPGARMGSVVGRDGLEQQYDSVLRGVDGIRYTEVDARGRMVREEVSSPSLVPIAGNPVKTTIDLPLQQYVDSIWRTELAGTRGALVAMTPKGEILALYSAPTFDPNEFVGRIPVNRWNAYNGDPALPLFNRVIRGTYPPASPFKLATAVMALRKGIIGFATHMPVPCRGGIQFGNRYIKCWKKEGHGSLDLTGAITASCDVYFYQLGLRLGLTDMLEDGTRLGFGERSGIDLGSEQRPSYPPNTRYFDRRYGPRGWTNAVTLNLAIGQGENSQSLMNMVRFYAALAGDGTVGPPYLVRPRDLPVRSLGLSAGQLAGLRDALAGVVQHGTAAASGGRDLNAAGKTGTAQNPHGKDHGWFIGFAPVDHPQIVVGSIMEEKLHGSSVAPYVIRVIRRYLVEQDPSLAHVRVKMPVLDDTIPTPLPAVTDTIP
ncbi:MAG TPA: penicillin-binding protein 2 [Gemmatimonadales bacterium]|jgi:penicillin-binding protein 2|nr:penicillin-binding protein 2 [Gemmatimonadales bacterium]